MKYFKILIILTSLLLACDNTDASKYAEYGDDLRDAIDNFENKRKKFSSEMEEIVKHTADELSEEDLDLTDIAKEWELKWKDLYIQYEDIKNDFQKVLLAQSIRVKIDKNIEELKSISERAKKILLELENFIAEGKKLVDGSGYL